MEGEGFFQNTSLTDLPKNVTNLPFNVCFYLEMPDSRIDCSVSDPQKCVSCYAIGRFITGGGKLQEFGAGHVISMAIWICTVIVGLFGSFTNSLIIVILTMRNSKRTFDLLLMALAYFDLFGSVTAIFASTSAVVMLENWNRDYASQLINFYASLLCYCARSGSTFMTVLIAIERYLVIAYPLKSIRWLTPGKTKFWIGFVFGMAAFIGIPRFTVFYIAPNRMKDIPSLSDWEYLSTESPLHVFWYRITLAVFGGIDFWLPLPLLLIFNIKVYLAIRRSTKARKQLNVNQEKDIKAIKMFVPVVIVLFLSNVEPYAHLFYIVFKKTLAREHAFGVVLAIAVNSAVNLPIYYMKGSEFRQEVKALFSKSCCCWSGGESGGVDGEGRHYSDDSHESGGSDVSTRSRLSWSSFKKSFKKHNRELPV